MTFEDGQEVLVEVDRKLYGKVVKRRLPGEDLYLVQIADQLLYCNANKLDVIQEPTESDQSRRLAELQNLAALTKLFVADPLQETLLRPEIMESLSKLGIFQKA